MAIHMALIKQLRLPTTPDFIPDQNIWVHPWTKIAIGGFVNVRIRRETVPALVVGWGTAPALVVGWGWEGDEFVLNVL